MSPRQTDVPGRAPWSWKDREPVLELDFDAAEFESRTQKVQAEMNRQDMDALIVYGGRSDEANVRYLSGFPSWWGDSVVVVPKQGAPTLVTNAIFHGEPMHSNVQKTWIRDLRPLLNPQSTGNVRSVIEVAIDAIREHGEPAKVGYANSKRILARTYREIVDGLPGVEIVDGSAILASLRRIKSPAEIEIIRRLSEITSIGMNAGMAAVAAGVAETELAGAVHGACVAAGAERMDFGCFSLSGPRGYMKNVWPMPGKKVNEGELVVFDVGAKLAGYTSDMSRNVVAGKPTDEIRRLLDACLEAHQAGREQTRPGETIESILLVMSKIIREHGFEEYDWTTSHGFGQDIVEDPFFYVGNRSLLEPGMTFFLEPMIVPPHIGTVCLEDSIVVTQNGCEQLTTSPLKTW